jgi:hypothetical protein
METESRANFSSDNRPPDRPKFRRDSTSIERMDLTASSGPITITPPDAKIMPDEDLVRAVQFGSSVAFGDPDATLTESDRVRIRHLEQIVCELLVKNEILRTRLAVAEK